MEVLPLSSRKVVHCFSKYFTIYAPSSRKAEKEREREHHVPEPRGQGARSCLTQGERVGGSSGQYPSEIQYPFRGLARKFSVVKHQGVQ